MIFFELVYTVFIGPLELLFEVVYGIFYRYYYNPGAAIFFLSLAINILVLPLYRRADAMQKQAEDIDAKLRDGVSHIKKTFSGDEKMMVLQTYYRQNQYKPADALKGSVPLLLQIPFFIAAYQFLSHLESLNGVSLGPIADLSRPDGILVIGNVTVNLLPILMTAINIIAGILYSKGSPIKTKIQLYGMALFFLVFLYGSPSGLVFYWTLNNLFSLSKQIFAKEKKHLITPSAIVLCALAANIALITYIIKIYHPPLLRQKYFMICMAALVELLLGLLVVIQIKKKSGNAKNQERRQTKREKIRTETPNPNSKIFNICMIFMTVLIGILIPSAFISASPQEYIDLVVFYHPVRYIAASAVMAAGAFLVWMKVFYRLANQRGKVILDRLAWIFCGLTLVNYMFFGTKLGNLSAMLQYDNGMHFSIRERILNVLVLSFIAGGMYFIVYKWNRISFWITVTASMALTVMSAINIVNIHTSIDKVSFEALQEKEQFFSLSTEGKNVVVIMLDRGMGAYIPYIMNENPKLQEQFAGFTYYPNTISFGGSTNFGLPGIMGGYEYTPVEMNKRAGEALVDKHSEAIKMMPVLFADHGYEVTVCDPVYVNYEWVPDISIFDAYPDINAYVTEGHFTSPQVKQQNINNNRRNFFCFSIMKTMPLFVQPILYADGTYNQNQLVGSVQFSDDMSKAEGISSSFMDAYNVLDNMSLMTNVTNENVDTFLYMTNNITHEPMLLLEPEYIPAQTVDNTEYDAENTWRFTADGKTLNMENSRQMIHYQTNMVAMMKLGEWFDFLRENDVYDNTKIIIVSDHGSNLYHFDELTFDNQKGNPIDAEKYWPLLLVKDFGSTEFSVSEEFMTNADVPVLATDDLIEHPTNPFTGKAITNSEKTAHEQYIILSEESNTHINNGNTFLPARWVRVKEDLWNRANWEFYDEEIVLDEYAFPSDTTK
ncbi:MAG: membrane protein insertase YidC [Clostridium sp.]|nr:membrane protein insertase YidC [Clostridium sp.]MCM1398183.1 membrane protein insertase YidC [Clostridium sp.]MCM1460403.1 membrane protein insertase YidC [Bacteroides sp.]